MTLTPAPNKGGNKVYKQYTKNIHIFLNRLLCTLLYTFLFAYIYLKDCLFHKLLYMLSHKIMIRFAFCLHNILFPCSFYCI